ncbi:MAG: nucleotidyltransferase domain-containing protein [archaeon]|nr:nucleotidyltransferase domain-containing protein [archaeon]
MSCPRVDHEEELSIDEIEAERELRDCADHLAPSGDQSGQRREQAQRLLTILRRAVPDGQVEVVGSEATGLSSRHSDVDIMVISPPQYPADAAKRGRSESATV